MRYLLASVLLALSLSVNAQDEDKAFQETMNAAETVFLPMCSGIELTAEEKIDETKMAMTRWSCATHILGILEGHYVTINLLRLSPAYKNLTPAICPNSGLSNEQLYSTVITWMIAFPDQVQKVRERFPQDDRFTAVVITAALTAAYPCVRGTPT